MLGRVGSQISRVLRPTVKSSCFVFSVQLARYVENGSRQHMASGFMLRAHRVACYVRQKRGP